MADQSSTDPVAPESTHSRLEERRPLDRVTFRATDEQLDALESLVEEGVYHSRSEAIRAGVQRLLEGHGRDDARRERE